MPVNTTHIIRREAARQRNGEFGTHEHSAPELTLNPSRGRSRNPQNVGASVEDGERVLYVAEYVHGHMTQILPRGLTATRRALKNRRGETDRGIRSVYLDWESVPPASGGEPLSVVGPKDGRPLIVHVQAGCPDLKIVSGRVIVNGRGNGFRVTVQNGAHADVIGQPGHKVSVTAEKGSYVNFFAEEGSRGYQSIEEGARFHLHGDSADLTLSTDLH